VQFGTRVRQGQLRGTYSDAERELLDIALAVDLRDNAILAVHIPDAIAVGVRPEAIEALLNADDVGLTPGERQIVSYGREVIAGNVTDASYAALRDRFGERGVVELTILVGFLLMTIRLWQALGVSQPSDEEIRELLRRLREGELEPPDANARIG
jgi:4-carboxymuconolactone decarboxylase